jgi:flagellar motor switch protein FliM
VRCQLGEAMDLWLRLSPPLVDACLGSLDAPRKEVPLSGAVQAMRNQCVALNVLLGEAEVTLAELQTLGVGDVLRLDRRVSEPLAVRLSDERVICAAHLGTRGDRKAVQLTNTN